jgi:uncharacterized membrane protein YhhN
LASPVIVARHRAAAGLLIGGGMIALSFLAARFVELPAPVEIGWKALGIALLGMGAWLSGARIAAAGLFFSALGDVFMELSPPNVAFGMAAFGAAHLFYIFAFLEILKQKGRSGRGLFFAALVVAASATMLFWFLPDMGALAAPGVCYHLIITAMVAVAVLSNASAPAKIGAAVFMLSDTLIALGLYKQIEVPPGSVWLFYSLAQISIAYAFSAREKAA